MLQFKNQRKPMSIKIGQTLNLGKKEYKIVATDKRSFVLECEGRQYKATEAKIQAMIEQEKSSQLEYPYLEARIKRMNVFKLNAKIPTNFQECIPFFERLTAELSPENLCCDGEASRAQIKNKQRMIHGEWKELEKISGRMVTETEIDHLTIGQYLKGRLNEN